MVSYLYCQNFFKLQEGILATNNVLVKLGLTAGRGVSFVPPGYGPILGGYIVSA